jgi:UDP-N-acetylglucosamine--N-acetylmuramyl-(pentapeptide) pyrophosphoryl-undecaprenol N-acetylglucosamine transferase
VNLVLNLGFAWRTIRERRPDVILSTGAGLAVPFFVVGRLLGVRLVYVESLTRTRGLSLSGRLVARLAHELFVHVTVGTPQQPFERLVRGLEAVSRTDLVVQYGPAAPPARAHRAVPFMSFSEMLEHFERADAVITHAGVGSILCASNAGHVPIVVPRLQRHGEHVDDHQLELVDELERTRQILVAWDVASLDDLLRTVSPKRPPAQRQPGPLHTAVRAALHGQPIPAELEGG